MAITIFFPTMYLLSYVSSCYHHKQLLQDFQRWYYKAVLWIPFLPFLQYSVSVGEGEVSWVYLLLTFTVLFTLFECQDLVFLWECKVIFRLVSVFLRVTQIIRSGRQIFSWVLLYKEQYITWDLVHRYIAWKKTSQPASN